MKASGVWIGNSSFALLIHNFLPGRCFPFDHSDKPFEIQYNENMYSDTDAYTASPGHSENEGFPESVLFSTFSNLSNSNDGRSTVSETINTYYIYSFDGRLLAEYDRNGSCVGDYIYSGNHLIAEYKPKTEIKK